MAERRTAERRSRAGGGPAARARLLLALALSLPLPSPATAAELPPRTEAVPGGIALVPLHLSGEAAPEARFGDRRVMVRRGPAGWVALVGLPLSATPGADELAVETPGGGRRRILFAVHAKRYPAQHISLRNRHLVNPTARDMQRIEREEREIHAALARWEDRERAEFPLAAPIHGRVTSAFGLRRFFNGEPRRPHSGLDIAAPRGTVVRAAGAGEVIDTGDYFFDGRAVFIDHGQGLVTMYFHLHTVEVKPGRHVTRGQPIGTVGMSGRATGPHLHFGLSLNGAMIDPDLVLGENVEGR